MKRFGFYLFLVLVSACSKVDQPIEPYSFDKVYKVVVSTNEKDLVVITIYKNDKELKTLNTNASIYHKYAIGWLKNENILVLNSSDVGVVAWSAAENFAPHAQPGKYERYGRQLFKSKYKST